MPDFATNYSPRYVIKYRVKGQNHQWILRQVRDAVRNDEGMLTKLAAVIDAASPILLDDLQVISGAYYAQDQFLGAPVDVNAIAWPSGDVSAAAQTPAIGAIQARFECRGNNGGRGSLSFFAVNVDNEFNDVANDFRVTTLENATVAAIVTALNELAPAWVPLGSTTVVWYPYTNFAQNKYWVRKLRG